jgi:ketosteroid isomerase-like protein
LPTHGGGAWEPPDGSQAEERNVQGSSPGTSRPRPCALGGRPLRAILRPVSEENVEKTRAFIDAYNARDFDAAVEDFDPGVEWVLPALQRSDSCRGPEEVRRFWEGLDETFDELRLEPQETVDGGDLVAMRLRYYMRGRESGAVIEGELYHQVTTFRDGKMVRIEYFTGWDEALEAAGLRA